MLSAIDRSLEAFERVHGLKVTIHDLDGSLAGAIDIKRTRHRHPICAQIKDSHHGSACYQFEYTALRPQLPQLHGGRIQRCHAGLVEWVMPVRDEQQVLRAVLFAGRGVGRGPPILCMMNRLLARLSPRRPSPIWRPPMPRRLFTCLKSPRSWRRVSPSIFRTCPLAGQ